jgi:hypothetical protein
MDIGLEGSVVGLEEEEFCRFRKYQISRYVHCIDW